MTSSKDHVLIQLVWTTHQRAALIEPQFESRLHQAMTGKALSLGCLVLAVGGTDDHVHMLLGLNPTVALADVVRQIKGYSSHLANASCAPTQHFRWQEGYGAFSVDCRSFEAARRYVLEQRERHALGIMDDSF